MTEREFAKHEWVMVRAWPVEASDAKAVASGAAFDASGEGELVGPMCGTCHQSYTPSTADMPCPGRVWTDEDLPTRRGLDAMPRKQRRERLLEDRRNQRRIRGGCPHTETKARWVPGPAGPVERIECAKCGTPMVKRGIPAAGPAPVLHSGPRR